MSEIVRVLGISGSLRKGSFNTALLRAAIALARPAGVHIEVASIGEIPLYDEDVRAQGFPESVAKLRDQIAAADALLVVTPEYNYSVPGVLKNAIRLGFAPAQTSFRRKALAIMGASTSLGGRCAPSTTCDRSRCFSTCTRSTSPRSSSGARRAPSTPRAGSPTRRPGSSSSQQLEALAAWAHRLQA